MAIPNVYPIGSPSPNKSINPEVPTSQIPKELFLYNRNPPVNKSKITAIYNNPPESNNEKFASDPAK